MSGRLIILRHKSWHVWNGDNQEKVLRDERIHREKEEAKQSYEKKQIQQKTLEALTHVADNSPNEAPCNTNSVVDVGLEQVESKAQHINFFEEHLSQSGANAEYQKEKARLEHLKRKREGIAPWALGEGSYEKEGKKPWYDSVGSLQGSSSSSSSVGDSGDNGKRHRHRHRHPQLDPMQGLLKSRVADKSPEIAVVEGGGERKRRKSGDGGGRAKRLREEGQGPGREPGGSATTPAPAPSLDADLMAALRRKRLERESAERKRSALLLAQVDIYGVDRWRAEQPR